MEVVAVEVALAVAMTVAVSIEEVAVGGGGGTSINDESGVCGESSGGIYEAGNSKWRC